MPGHATQDDEADYRRVFAVARTLFAASRQLGRVETRFDFAEENPVLLVNPDGSACLVGPVIIGFPQADRRAFSPRGQGSAYKKQDYRHRKHYAKITVRE